MIRVWGYSIFVGCGSPVRSALLVETVLSIFGRDRRFAGGRPHTVWEARVQTFIGGLVVGALRMHTGCEVNTQRGEMCVYTG